jgi:hypothetical protein
MTTPPPDRLAEWAVSFAEELIAPTLPERWAHDLAVIAKARRFAAGLGEEDADALIAAAALHDVGFAPAAIDCAFQPLDGARHLAGAGVPMRICALIANCVSARVEGRLRGFGEAYGDLPDEKGPVRDALWAACITTDSSGGDIDVDERIDLWPSRYPEPVVIEFVALAREPLREAVARSEARLGG